MSVSILWNKNQILRVTRGVFELMYETLLSIIEDNEIHVSQNLQYLIDDFAMGNYGVGLDLAKYLFEKRDIEEFAMLIKRTITLLENSYPHIMNQVRNDLLIFHKTLLENAKTFN